MKSLISMGCDDMSLSDKYDALLQRFMALEDENKALRATVAAVHACATAKEASELDSLIAEYGNATDCARSIMITPAVWGKIATNK
jgi:vacuolar-type H+-ATPase subunit D/Vma8